MSLISPRAILALVAAQVPESCRQNIIVVGSLAAAYHLLAGRPDDLVRTKDIDCVLVPRVEALRAGKTVADTLLAAGWRRRAEGPHAAPGSPNTPDDALPVIRLNPPDSTDWYIELLGALNAGDTRDRAFERVVLSDGGHYALASFRHLDVAAHQPLHTAEGLRCARLSMLVLSNLLRNPTIRPDRMLAPAGPGPRRSNKDLGRVVTLARLAGRATVATWPTEWADALRVFHSTRWTELAARAGDGIRALLASEGDLQEALSLSRIGLLAHVPMTVDEFRIAAERFLVDAVEQLEAAAAG
jgi:hypothetical protein